MFSAHLLESTTKIITYIPIPIREQATVFKYEILSFLKRPEEYCSDTTPMDNVIQHASDHFADDEIIWILLQPTSPLRTATHIRDCIEIFKSTTDESLVISVSEKSPSYLKVFYLNKRYQLQ